VHPLLCSSHQMTETGQNGSYGDLLPQRLLRRRKRPIDAGLIDLHESAATPSSEATEGVGAKKRIGW
jgi:hypothetical protein